MRREGKAKVVKVVLDTNVYISAILFGGKPERIINMARSGEIELLISPDILAEVARVLEANLVGPMSRLG